jgi:hypothetical protein
MRTLIITTYTRPIPTNGTTPADWWWNATTTTGLQKKALNVHKGMIRANTKHGKDQYVSFQIFANDAAVTSYNTDLALSTSELHLAQASLNTYNSARGITSTTTTSQIA